MHSFSHFPSQPPSMLCANNIGFHSSKQQSAIYHSILSPFTWKTLIDLAQRQNNKMIDKSTTCERCTNERMNASANARLFIRATWNVMWERCTKSKRCERQTIDWQWQWQWQWILAEDFAVTLLEDGMATNFVRRVQAMWKKIINLEIIYCGLEFMVHSSFGSGMNRKYSFITISAHNTYCVSCWIEQTSGQATRKKWAWHGE